MASIYPKGVPSPLAVPALKTQHPARQRFLDNADPFVSRAKEAKGKYADHYMSSDCEVSVRYARKLSCHDDVHQHQKEALGATSCGSKEPFPQWEASLGDVLDRMAGDYAALFTRFAL